MSKILFIIPTLKQGGAERVLYILTCALKFENKLTILDVNLIDEGDKNNKNTNGSFRN